jgi:hypothetical protein
MSSTGLVSITGCAEEGESEGDMQDSDGDGVIDSEDYAPHDPEVQEKSDIQAQSSETPTDTPSPTSSETPTSSEDTEQEAFENYRAGYRDVLSSAETTELAAEDYNNEDYFEAEQHYHDSLETNREGRQNFERALELIDESEYPEAYESAQAAVEFSSVAIESRNVAIDACQAAQDDNFEQSRELMNEVSNEYHERLDEINNAVLDLDQMREALGV